MMNRQKQYLIVAILSTVCAVIWLVNCGIDVVLGCEVRSQYILHAVCAAVWTVSSVLWWIRWRHDRFLHGEAA